MQSNSWGSKTCSPKNRLRLQLKRDDRSESKNLRGYGEQKDIDFTTALEQQKQ
jgi:hypothetical protein